LFRSLYCFLVNQDQYKFLVSLLDEEDIAKLNELLSHVQIGSKIIHSPIESLLSSDTEICIALYSYTLMQVPNRFLTSALKQSLQILINIRIVKN
jgi:hypothetical protein